MKKFKSQKCNICGGPARYDANLPYINTDTIKSAYKWNTKIFKNGKWSVIRFAPTRQEAREIAKSFRDFYGYKTKIAKSAWE